MEDISFEQKLKQIEYIQKILYETNTVSLNEIVKNDENDLGDTEVGDMIASEGYNPEELMQQDETRMSLLELINKLPDTRQIVVLKLRFGFADNTYHTLEDIGHMYGVTRERIRQVEAKALRNLRHIVEKKNLHFEDF